MKERSPRYRRPRRRRKERPPPSRLFRSATYFSVAGVALLLLSTLFCPLGYAFIYPTSTSAQKRTGCHAALLKEPSDVLPSSDDDEFRITKNDDSFVSYSVPKVPKQPSSAGLSKFHLSILSRTEDRQRFVTGRYPVYLQIKENPTRKWLNMGRKVPAATTEILVNGTAPARSLASFGRFQWLDDAERILEQQEYGMVSVELLAEINIDRPGYLQILDANGAGARAAAADLEVENTWQLRALKLLKQAGTTESVLEYYANRDRLWVTGFSLVGRQGLVTAVDCESCSIIPVNRRSRSTMLWPNEVQHVPAKLLSPPLETRSSDPHRPTSTKNRKPQYQDALLVCDGFLVPTKDRGGLYVVKHPGHETESTVCLTKEKARWFYHRAVWVDLTGDGRKSILTARCRVSTALSSTDASVDGMASGVTKSGELVWLECPKPDRIDDTTGVPLDSDGSVFDPFHPKYLPWQAHVLAAGPDVMFCIADLNPQDDTIEVLSSQFFPKTVVLHSIKRCRKPHVTFSRVIDEQCGQAFGSVLANLDLTGTTAGNCRVIDSGSTVECLQQGDSFSHLLVTSHECTFVDGSGGDTEPKNGSDESVPLESKTLLTSPEGGSLFAYKVPAGKNAWKTDPWKRSTIASGFKVDGKLNNMINPGAPGFVYTFYPKKSDRVESRRPMIAVAGDCAESAYIFRPKYSDDSHGANTDKDKSTTYELMVEILCQSTVGSIGIGYDDFSSTDQESGYAKLYVPCYEKDKILVFGLGSGKDDTSGW